VDDERVDSLYTCGPRACEEHMKFGVTIPNNWGLDDPQQVLAMGPVAEALGYDSTCRCGLQWRPTAASNARP
jgi:hypothetical protein